MRVSHRSGSAQASVRCSGAKSFANATAASIPIALSTSTWSASTPSSSPLTSVAIAGSVLTRMARASAACSAWARRSAATQAAGTDPSVRTRISDGPAGISMATSPNTASLAAVTKALPGPKILSTRRTDSVPYAMAAIACAPPTAWTSVTPASPAAASTAGAICPSRCGGEHMTISSQPARRAGMASMRTDDG